MSKSDYKIHFWTIWVDYGRKNLSASSHLILAWEDADSTPQWVSAD